MNIIIAGLTCSGKTTLSNEILNASILREDDYMKDRTSIPNDGKYYLMDLPEAYNLCEYKNDVNMLLTNGFVYYPHYDFKSNTRINKNRKLLKSNINVFEGLHAIDTLKNLRNSLKVFMDTSIDTCLERRIKRDKSLYKVDEELIKKYFKEIIIPIYKSYIESQKDMADVVIRGEGDILCLKKKLLSYY
jgi:uridine kinase